MDLKIELINVNDLTLDPNNARKHNKKNIEAIGKSLQQFGQRKPIVITQNNVVVAGNGTLLAAKEIGWKGINCVRVPADWSEETIKVYALADNRTAELADWDNVILLEQLNDLDVTGWDLKSLGFDMPLHNNNSVSDDDVRPQLGETKYAVIIDCDSEWQQSELLQTLSAQHLKVRPLML